MKRLYDSLRQCQKIFPSATCFQYDYLADDVAALGDSLPLGYVRKMPPKLVADLANRKDEDLRAWGGREYGIISTQWLSVS